MKQSNWLKKYGHCLILLYLPLYLFCFWLLEIHTAAHYTDIYCRFDTYIPFMEGFIIPYLLWFPFLLGGIAYLLYLSFREPEVKRDFIRVGVMLIIGMSLCLLVYTFFPNSLHIRPTSYPRDNVFSYLCGLIQGMDPPTNVCPSMHVFSTLALFFVIWNSHYFQQKKPLYTWIRYGSLLLTIAISISTVFIKQHSVVDVVFGLLLAIVLYFLCNVMIKPLKRK